MPVFQETAHASRDLRVLPTRGQPLPRLTPPPPRGTAQDSSPQKHEVVVIGAGPAGLFLTLLLSRLGLASSVACYDEKLGSVKAGQADGLQPRTLEVLQSLGLADEILRDGCHMSEVAFWNPVEGIEGGGIERTAFVPDVSVRCRFRHEVTIHQGRIERILEEDLVKYTEGGVVRGARFVGFQFDAETDTEFPIAVKIDRTRGDGSTERETVRTKYLVGADGAHSAVRKAMGLRLEGETTDHIWGVCDFVAETDFPDVRKRSAIHSRAGSIMVIPRERTTTGEYLTRLYVQIKEEVAVGGADKEVQERDAKARRAAITLEYIFEQAKRVLAPYTIAVKQGTDVDWWAAYQIGQRMTPSFSMKDSRGYERVFIVGDACHTHSPKAGQGMNVSMMDSFNLAWKLVHTIHGLTPMSTSTTPSGKVSATSPSLLSTYSHERLTIARQLIAFDTEFSSMFSGAIGPSSQPESVANLTHEQFLKVFSDGNGFTSGCGIEYPAGILVERSNEDDECWVRKGGDYLNGCLKPGRRLLDLKVRRFADANVRHLQDDFLFTGRYRILVLASTDIHSQDGISAATLNHICHDIIPTFHSSTVELVVVHPFEEQRFEWTDVPACIKNYAEMRFHGVGGGDEVYDTYGIDDKKGAVVVIRPDGYVGLVTLLQNVIRVSEFLGRCMVRTDCSS